MNKILSLLLVSLMLTSACTYRLSNSCLPAEFRLLTVEEVDNQTSEAALAAMLRSALQERIANEPGINLARGRKKQEARICVRLKNLHNSSVARARLRDERDRDDDSDAYQTVLYRITLAAEYQLYVPAEPEKPRLSGNLSATADLPKIHDREIALRSALQQATLDLAGKIVNAVTELR